MNSKPTTWESRRLSRRYGLLNRTSCVTCSAIPTNSHQMYIELLRHLIYRNLDSKNRIHYILDGIRIPPSIRMTVPFNIVFSTLCFTSAANSLGNPGRTGNSIAVLKDFLTLSLIKAVTRTIRTSFNNRIGYQRRAGP